MKTEETHSVVHLVFNPLQCKCKGTRKVFQDDIARTLYLAWRRRHIVGKTFPYEVLRIAEKIRESNPTTIRELEDCFLFMVVQASNFTMCDVTSFCHAALPYFTGEKTIGYKLIYCPQETDQ